ncbi:MAG: hypothetical protein HY360_22280 [Verrucomicrobia bacterium]|nr:hypothetical protein [Verrucomicrobiota bacterium]
MTNSVPLPVRKKFKDWTSVYSSAPHLSPTVIRELARAAGLHIYSESDDGCYPASVLVGLHARDAGHKTIALPQRQRRIFDLLTDQTLGTNTNTISFPGENHRTYLIGWE